MGTQGVVTVKTGNTVLMKVVAGQDGYLAKDVANQLKQDWPVSAQDAYDLALEVGFGGESTLVVITETDFISQDCDEEQVPLYRQTFQKPEFNPRWEHGIADHMIVVDI